jgi:hypothetical protein
VATKPDAADDAPGGELPDAAAEKRSQHDITSEITLLQPSDNIPGDTEPATYCGRPHTEQVKTPKLTCGANRNDPFHLGTPGRAA